MLQPAQLASKDRFDVLWAGDNVQDLDRAPICPVDNQIRIDRPEKDGSVSQILAFVSDPWRSCEFSHRVPQFIEDLYCVLRAAACDVLDDVCELDLSAWCQPISLHTLARVALDLLRLLAVRTSF